MKSDYEIQIKIYDCIFLELSKRNIVTSYGRTKDTLTSVANEGSDPNRKAPADRIEQRLNEARIYHGSAGALMKLLTLPLPLDSLQLLALFNLISFPSHLGTTDAGWQYLRMTIVMISPSVARFREGYPG
jgi:hypothetical protein